jgi:pyruvate/oxaloacetate carboxyltransferase
MVDATDMSTPVTRGELREELEHFRQELKQEFRHELNQELVHLATKAELAQLASQMATKAELAQLASQMATKADLAQMATKADLAQMATKADLEIWGGALFERLLTELARHVRASQEALSKQISALDDKYADLPARVHHLETAVFGPRQR